MWALRTFCPSSEMGANHTPAYPPWTCLWFYLLMERSGLKDGAGGIITTSLRPVLKNLTPWSVFCKPTWYVPSSVVHEISPMAKCFGDSANISTCAFQKSFSCHLQGLLDPILSAKFNKLASRTVTGWRMRMIYSGLMTLQGVRYLHAILYCWGLNEDPVLNISYTIKQAWVSDISALAV